MLSLQNRVVVVTGGGSGIGRAAALLFAEQGAKLVLAGRTLSKLEETAKTLANRDTEVLSVSADVGTSEGATRLFNDTMARFGQVDVLIHNAGVGYSHGVENPGSMETLDQTPEDMWHEVMRINLDSVYFLCRRAIQEFQKQGEGVIVNVASVGGLRGMQDAHTYATAKAGMVNLTRSLAKTYGPQNIRSNILAPGFVATDMVKPVLDSSENPFAADETRFLVSPLGRPGTVDEIAEGLLFLATNTYCNGAILVLDGGSSA